MEPSAFYALAEKHRDMVYRIALNFHRSIPDAEDTAQEVLLKLFLRSEPFESPEHTKHWLIRVTLNQCRSMLRNPLRRACSLEELSGAISFAAPGESDIFQSVMALPRNDRTALYLFYYEELSVREIAEALHLSETAITSRLSRARKRLKQGLEADANGI